MAAPTRSQLVNMPDLRIVHGPEATSASEIVQHVRSTQRGRSPFDEAFFEFGESLSRDLRRGALGSQPAVAALAFWIRPSSLRRLGASWRHENTASGVLRRPRGVVFHLPPTNVDTLFVYSWLLSAAVGNGNIIRLSPNAIETIGPLLDVVCQNLVRHEAIGSSTAIVSYGHDASITADLSAAEVRVIWGGDDAVRSIRSVPMPPQSVELAFADRFSLAAFGADAILALDEAGLADLAKRFYNDSYWFDQLGCSSPRAVVWCGGQHAVEKAASRFWRVFKLELDRSCELVTTSTVIEKLVYSADLAASADVAGIDWKDNRVTVATVQKLHGFDRESPGGGMFVQYRVRTLAEVAPVLERRDQTLSVFGVSPVDVLALIESTNGIDRSVPVGSALEFGRYWDGHDLLAAFSRIVDLRSGPPESERDRPEGTR